MECSFHPTRYGEKVSNTYLRKLGREKATPEDFFRYENERQKRNEVRKQIMDEIQDKELTFKPRMDGNSVKIQEKLKNAGLIGQDPVTKTTLVCTSHKSALSSAFSPSSKEKIHRNSSANNFNSKMAGTSTDVDPRSNSSTHRDSAELYEGPTLIIESEHPYRHNTSEYTTVQVPGAVSYAITFSEETHTESVYDYIKFFDDDTHTYHFGAGKYCGGTNNTPCNWPGLGNRPPLIIPSSKFIIYFKTNGSVNDWGFRMHVVPTLRSVSPTGADSSYRDDGFHSPRGNPQLFAVSRNPRNISASSVNDTGIPTISTLGKNYNSPERRVISSKGKIHERLYRQVCILEAFG